MNRAELVQKAFEMVDSDYIIAIRRELHMYPEVDFDLPKTVALVKRELDAMGVSYTDKIGRSAVVATINPEKTNFTIGIRADMDALLITEDVDWEYKSKIDGKMHACGHDAHTAMLLGTVKVLNQIKDQLDCRVKFIFQPSEEGADSGAKYLVRDGVMDDIDVIIATHIENLIEAGTIGVCPGWAMASSRPFTIRVKGKSAHGTMPQDGVDTVAVCNRIYSAVQLMLTRELSPFTKWVCGIHAFNGGTAHNIVSPFCEMKGTIRAYEKEVDEFIINRIESICKSVCEDMRATYEIETELLMGAVYNNEKVIAKIAEAGEMVVGKENVVPLAIKMGSEDFATYLTKKPGAFFRTGTRNDAKGFGGLQHNSDFQIDESVLQNGVKVFCKFVIDNQDGMEL